MKTNTVMIILFLFIFNCIITESKAQVKTDWIKVHHSVSQQVVQEIEKSYGLKNQGSGWTKQDGLMIPSFHFFCYRPMEFEQARELYSQVITLLQKEVKSELVKKGVSEEDYERIPVEFMLTFVRPAEKAKKQ